MYLGNDMKNGFTLLVGVLLMLIPGFEVFAQPSLKTVTFEELLEVKKSEPKPIFIFFTADWCRYCKNVEQTSFKDKTIVETLNKNFYVELFDIETNHPIDWNGRTFTFKSTGIGTGVHELAEELGTIDGVLNTPTFMLMDKQINVIFRYGGYMDSKQILAMLQAVHSQFTSQKTSR